MRSRELQELSESLNVVVRLKELIVDRRVRNRCFMENGVEAVISKLLPPIDPRNITRDKITFESLEVLEIP